MSRNQVVHRNLQPRHIMVDGFERPNVKIIDYVQAVQPPHVEAPYHVSPRWPLPRVLALWLTGQQGCVFYRPPDVNLGNVDYGFEYDIWSLGCM